MKTYIQYLIALLFMGSATAAMVAADKLPEDEKKYFNNMMITQQGTPVYTVEEFDKNITPIGLDTVDGRLYSFKLKGTPRKIQRIRSLPHGGAVYTFFGDPHEELYHKNALCFKTSHDDEEIISYRRTVPLVVVEDIRQRSLHCYNRNKPEKPSVFLAENYPINPQVLIARGGYIALSSSPESVKIFHYNSNNTKILSPTNVIATEAACLLTLSGSKGERLRLVACNNYSTSKCASGSLITVAQHKEMEGGWKNIFRRNFLEFGPYIKPYAKVSGSLEQELVLFSKNRPIINTTCHGNAWAAALTDGDAVQLIASNDITHDENLNCFKKITPVVFRLKEPLRAGEEPTIFVNEQGTVAYYISPASVTTGKKEYFKITI